MSDTAAEFWRFSLAVYAGPGVPPACLMLQDRFARDVNVALYCCWLGASGRGRLDRAALEEADRLVAPWRVQVVEKLRAARRAIKAAAPLGGDALYAKAKAIELEAERTLQGMLAAHAPPADPARGTAQRLADSFANLALYVGEEAPVEPLHAALRALQEANFASA